MYLVFWTQNVRARIWTVLLWRACARIDRTEKKRILFNILNRLQHYNIAYRRRALNENQWKQKSRFKLNYLRVIYISQVKYTQHSQRSMCEVVCGWGRCGLAENSDRMTANTVLFHAPVYLFWMFLFTKKNELTASTAGPGGEVIPNWIYGLRLNLINVPQI